MRCDIVGRLGRAGEIKLLKLYSQDSKAGNNFKDSPVFLSKHLPISDWEKMITVEGTLRLPSSSALSLGPRPRDLSLNAQICRPAAVERKMMIKDGLEFLAGKETRSYPHFLSLPGHTASQFLLRGISKLNPSRSVALHIGRTLGSPGKFLNSSCLDCTLDSLNQYF